MRRVLAFMANLRHKRFHGEFTVKYFDGRVTNILTNRNDKPETLEVLEGADLDKVIDEVFRG